MPVRSSQRFKITLRARMTVSCGRVDVADFSRESSEMHASNRLNSEIRSEVYMRLALIGLTSMFRFYTAPKFRHNARPKNPRSWHGQHVEKGI